MDGDQVYLRELSIVTAHFNLVEKNLISLFSMQFEDGQPSDLHESRAKSELEKLQVANQSLFINSLSILFGSLPRCLCLSRTG